MNDIELKKEIVENIGYNQKEYVMNKVFAWIKDAPDKKDIELRIWCIRHTKRYKSLYRWITNRNKPFIRKDKEDSTTSCLRV